MSAVFTHIMQLSCLFQVYVFTIPLNLIYLVSCSYGDGVLLYVMATCREIQSGLYL